MQTDLNAHINCVSIGSSFLDFLTNDGVKGRVGIGERCETDSGESTDESDRRGRVRRRGSGREITGYDERAREQVKGDMSTGTNRQPRSWTSPRRVRE